MNKEILYRIESEFIEKTMDECEDWDPKAILAYMDGAVKVMAAMRKELDNEEKSARQKQRTVKKKPPQQKTKTEAADTRSEKRGSKQKVDEAILEEMWNGGATTEELAEMFGVSKRTINKYAVGLRAKYDGAM